MKTGKTGKKHFIKKIKIKIYKKIKIKKLASGF
jgi:hypothetical protein